MRRNIDFYLLIHFPLKFLSVSLSIHEATQVFSPTQLFLIMGFTNNWMSNLEWTIVSSGKL